jgi:hypothetical protein
MRRLPSLVASVTLVVLAPALAAQGMGMGGVQQRGLPQQPEFRLPSFPRANEIVVNDVAKRLLAERGKLQLTDAQVATLTAMGNSLFTANGDALVPYDAAQRRLKPPTTSSSAPDEETLKQYRTSMPVMLEAMDRVVTNEERAAAAMIAALDEPQRERAQGIWNKRRGQLVEWRKPLETVRPRRP